MENLFYCVITGFSIIGWYILIREVINSYLFKNYKIDDDIKLQIIVKNKEDNIEFLARKIMYIQNKLGDFKTIEIIDNKSNDDTYKILEKLKKENSNLKIRKIE